MEPVAAIGPDTCLAVTPDEIEDVVAQAVDGLEFITSENGWSSVCARVQPFDRVEAPYDLTIKIAWEGTFLAFDSMPGARPVAGIADEAFAFDDGQQTALRSGELAAVVTVSREVSEIGVSASDVRALARLVADHLEG